MCLKKTNLFKTISLLVRTVAQKIEDSRNNINNHLKYKQIIEWFSLGLDELTVFFHQYYLLICGGNAKFDVIEELASMNSPCGTDIGEIFSKKLRKH